MKNHNEDEEKPDVACEQNKGDSSGLYFQVFGLDFIISKEGDPYLLEVNTNPCL